MTRSDHSEEIRVKALMSKNNLRKRRFTDAEWKLNAPGYGLLDKSLSLCDMSIATCNAILLK